MTDNARLDELRPFSPSEVRDAQGFTQVWVGLTSDCPLDRRRVGNICLMKRSFYIVRDGDGVPMQDDSGLSETHKVDGKIEHLTIEQVRHIVSRTMKTVIRVVELDDIELAKGGTQTGRHKVRAIKTYADKGYVPSNEDRVLSDFVYVLPASESSGFLPDQGFSRGGSLRGRPQTITTDGEVTLPDWIAIDPKAKKSKPRAKKPEPAPAAAGSLDLGQNTD